MCLHALEGCGPGKKKVLKWVLAAYAIDFCSRDLNPSPPSTPKRTCELTRDQKLEIRTLRKYIDYTYLEIARRTGYTVRQV